MANLKVFGEMSALIFKHSEHFEPQSLKHFKKGGNVMF